MSLRNKLIRLAYEQPQLRDDLLPLITKSAKNKKYEVSFFKYSYRGTKIEKTETVDAISPAHAKDQVSSLYGIKKKTITSVKEIKSKKSASIRITDTYSGATVTVEDGEMLYFPLVKGSRITVVELPAKEMISYLKRKQGQRGPFTAYLDKADAISDTKDTLRRHSQY